MNSFEPGGGMPGGNVLVNDVVGGSWFTFPNANTEPDEDQRVLLGQFTTDGIVSGSLGLQILPKPHPPTPMRWTSGCGLTSPRNSSTPLHPELRRRPVWMPE